MTASAVRPSLRQSLCRSQVSQATIALAVLGLTLPMAATPARYPLLTAWSTRAACTRSARAVTSSSGNRVLILPSALPAHARSAFVAAIHQALTVSSAFVACGRSLSARAVARRSHVPTVSRASFAAARSVFVKFLRMASDTDEELADRAAAFLRFVCLGRFIELEDACDVRTVAPRLERGVQVARRQLVRFARHRVDQDEVHAYSLTHDRGKRDARRAAGRTRGVGGDHSVGLQHRAVQLEVCLEGDFHHAIQ